MKGNRLLRIALALLAGVAAGAQHHPVIPPIEGFSLESREYQGFASYGFHEVQGGREIETRVEGKYWFLYYEHKSGARNFSRLEILRNHRAAALEAGGRILSEDEAKLDFSVPGKNGETLWAHVHAWDNSYELTIIEEAGFDKRLTLGAEEMKTELDQAGRVALYGIYFDFDKAVLRPESRPTLEEIARLLNSSSELLLHVVGHTDNVGTFAYNLELSRRRAEAVVAALVSDFGIASRRLHPAGVGPLAPAASNVTEEGRARNRRVELVRQ